MERTAFFDTGIICAEQFYCSLMRGGRESEERLVLVHALGKYGTYEIRRHIDIFFVNSFFFRICFDCFVNVKQRSAKCLRTLTGLTLMSFVNDNSVLSVCNLVKILVCKQEFLNSTDDNSLLIVDSIYQATRTLFIIDSFYESGLVVKTIDCVLELAIQHHTVSYNDNCIKDGIVIVVVKRGKSIGYPSNGI